MKSILRVWALASLTFFAPAIVAVAATATVTLAVAPPDAGKVTGAGSYTVGASASLTATASNGWKFVIWSDGTNTASRKVTVPSNGVSLTASFAVSTGILSISPTNLALGSVPITLAASQAVTLANSGPGAISVTGVTLPAGFTTTPTSFSIASNTSRQVYIVFKPTSTTTAYGGAVKFTSNAARVPAGLTVSGSGIAQTRALRLAGDLAFGEVLGGLSATRPLTVYNDGNSPMSVTAVAWSNNTGTAFSATPTAFTVPAGGTSTMTVAFAPKATGSWNAALVLTVTSLTGGTRSIGITGSGRQPLVVLAVNPSDAGKVTGAGAYNVGASATLAATASNNWRFVNWSDGSNTASRKVTVPSNGVSLTASFAVSTGILSISPTNLALGSVPITLAASQAVTLANSGPGAISVTGVTLPAGFTTTPTSFSIASNTSRQVYIVFKPTSTTTAYGGAVKFTSNAARVPAGLTVSGSGIAQTRTLRFAGDLAFGEVPGGLTNTLPLNVCNDGNSPMSVTAVAWSNNTGTAFSATPTAFTVPTGGTSTMTVAFAPRTTAVWNATLVLTATSLTGGTRAIAATGSGRQPHVVLTVNPPGAGTATGAGAYNVGASAPLTATASNGWRFANWSDGPTNRSRVLVMPTNDVSLTANFASTSPLPGILSFSATFLDFGSVVVGGVATQTFGLVNAGPSAVSVTGLTLSAVFTASPSVFSVPSGSTQQVRVVFAPTQTVAYSSGVIVQSNAGGVSNSLALSGQGAAATRIVRLAGDLNFGEQLVEQRITRTLTVYNDGNTAMTVGSVTWTNNADGSFSNSPAGFSVPPGASVAMNVYFKPKAAQLYTNIAMALTIAGLTGGTPSIAVAGGASAWGNGTWDASLLVTGIPLIKQSTVTGTAYVWQDGTNVVAEIKASYTILTQSGNIDDVFSGTVQNRTNIVGLVSSNGSSSRTMLTLYYSPGLTSPSSQTDPTIVSGAFPYQTYTIVATMHPRNTTNNPSIAKPVVPAAVPAPSAILMGAALPMTSVTVATAPPSLILTVLPATDGAAPACAPDGRCAVLEMRDGVAAVIFPDGIEPLTGVPAIVLQAVGPDANANGLPDSIETALGFVPPEGWDLLTLREVDGWLLLETPYIDRLFIKGAAVPDTQLPASWQVTPRGK